MDIDINIQMTKKRKQYEANKKYLEGIKKDPKK